MIHSRVHLKLIFLIMFLVVLLFAQDTITDVHGRSSEGTLVGFKPNRVIFKIVGANEPTEFISTQIEKILSITGVSYDRATIAVLCRENQGDQNPITINQTVQNEEEKNIPQLEQYNPCQDEQYLKLKKLDLNALSDREYNYFLQKDKDCSEWIKLQYQSQKSATDMGTEKGIVKPFVSREAVQDKFIAGKMTAEKYYVTNAGFGGFACGFLGGLIGWGLGYAVVNGMEIEIPYNYYYKYSIEDQLKFQEGYKTVAKKKRNDSFHTGAAVGTGTIVVLVLIFSSAD